MSSDGIIAIQRLPRMSVNALGDDIHRWSALVSVAASSSEILGCLRKGGGAGSSGHILIGDHARGIALQFGRDALSTAGAANRWNFRRPGPSECHGVAVGYRRRTLDVLVRAGRKRYPPRPAGALGASAAGAGAW